MRVKVRCSARHVIRRLKRVRTTATAQIDGKTVARKTVRVKAPRKRRARTRSKR